jgi:hypothetical protein
VPLLVATPDSDAAIIIFDAVIGTVKYAVYVVAEAPTILNDVPANVAVPELVVVTPI